MRFMSSFEQDSLQKYLEEKAKQAQESELESELVSAYDAFVLKDSANIHELIAETQKNSTWPSED